MAKFAFITGATSGFGEATARIFAKNGYSLVLLARRKDRLEQLKNELSSSEIQVEILCADVRNEEEVNSCIASLSDSIKNGIQILINNAGLAVGRGPIDTGLTDDWERMIDTNIKGLLYVSKAIIPFLKAIGNGHIINLASIAG